MKFHQGFGYGSHEPYEIHRIERPDVEGEFNKSVRVGSFQKKRSRDCTEKECTDRIRILESSLVMEIGEVMDEMEKDGRNEDMANMLDLRNKQPEPGVGPCPN